MCTRWCDTMWYTFYCRLIKLVFGVLLLIFNSGGVGHMDHIPHELHWLIGFVRWSDACRGRSVATIIGAAWCAYVVAVLGRHHYHSIGLKNLWVA